MCTRAFSCCIALLLILLNAGCSYKHQHVLFKTDYPVDMRDKTIMRVSGQENSVPIVPILSVGDRIDVRVANTIELAATPLSKSEGKAGDVAGYLIAIDSLVALPMIGRVNLVGLTRPQAAAKLEELYKKYLKDPVIIVEILNLNYSILGEVQKPGIYPLNQEKLHLTQAISQAGGFTVYSKKRNVKIIRGDLKNPEVLLVNLTNIETIESDELIIRNKDIIYIEPRNGRLVNEVLGPILPFVTIITSIASTIILGFRFLR